MTILQISVLAALAIGLGRLSGGRQLAMLALSALAVFWLQPSQPDAGVQFWIPLGTLALVVAVWAITAPSEVRGLRQNWPAALVLIIVVVIADLNRYLGLQAVYFTNTPRPLLVLLALAALSGIALLLGQTKRAVGALQLLAIVCILGVFAILKVPSLQSMVGAWVANLAAPAPGGAPAAANVIAVAPGFQWLGYSYLAFRLLHTILDRRSGKLPALTLVEYVNYAIFFPAFTAGPIDRAERFVQELRAPRSLEDADWVEAGSRIVTGAFKKFVLADMLAVISISEFLAPYVKTGGWLWLFVYAYSLRIFLDFSGYTDVAIGMARLMGVRLPENFAAPYLKPNLTQFWSAWHMTLTQWFRAYFFNPIVRAMRTAERPLPDWLGIFVAQTATMVLIGLWHGVTWSFVAWGLWHGIGLFIHNRWAALAGGRMPAWAQSKYGARLLTVSGTFLTFNFVSVGWLFFSFSSPLVAWQTLLRLFGAG